MSAPDLVALQSEVGTNPFLDDLLSDAKPVERVEVVVAGGRVLVFRQIQTYDEMELYKREARKFYQTVRTAPNLAWAHLVPKEDRAIAVAFSLHYLSVEPAIDVVYALRFVNEAPFLCEQIVAELALGSSQGLNKVIQDAMEAEGNGFEQTSGDGMSSLSAENTSEPIQTD